MYLLLLSSVSPHSGFSAFRHWNVLQKIICSLVRKVRSDGTFHAFQGPKEFQAFVVYLVIFLLNIWLIYCGISSSVSKSSGFPGCDKNKQWYFFMLNCRDKITVITELWFCRWLAFFILHMFDEEGNNVPVDRIILMRWFLLHIHFYQATNFFMSSTCSRCMYLPSVLFCELNIFSFSCYCPVW